MKKLSVLQNFDSRKLIRQPFPYLVLQNALPDYLYKELSDTYPSDKFIVENDARKKTSFENARANTRYQISAKQVFDKTVQLTPLWEDFIAFHTSNIFLDQFMEIFGNDIQKIFPDFEKKMKRPIGQIRSGIRHFKDNPKECDIALDCQIGINSHVIESGRVTGPHCDSPEELYAGLFYMRPSHDESTGGDLALYEWENKRLFYDKSKVKDNLVREFSRVPYSENCFVVLLNTENSVHGVTPRSITNNSRRLVNIIGEVYPRMPEGLFKTTKTNTQNVMSWLKRKKSIIKR